ncbi:hypothetical protein G3O08_15665 [Cryomorpha ignava]|uniref:Autotransporter outer membrane beta-barrel domain-containing protein n=1 Tax=Cryomorpha ignava TaxID=101383 RepID=A0A7K3WTR1_9FLAO|nr:hypothetical protein [Cryomorpha ignava]NEN24938.1 hypothetical protein [Cryomorpha ignava]
MNKKFIILFVAVVFSSVYNTDVFGQDLEDSKEKRFDHFVGLQGNLLIREFFNFGEENNEIDNPYLLTYTMRSTKSGYALNAGFGYNSTNRENDDGVRISQQIVDIRFGPGYQFKTGKFEFGVGVDVIYRGRSIDTFSRQVVEFSNAVDSTVATTRSAIQGFGGGIQATGRFYLSDRFLIGTEASFNYISGNEKFNSENINYVVFQGVTTTTYQVENEKADVESWQFKLPVVIYLIVKF